VLFVCILFQIYNKFELFKFCQLVRQHGEGVMGIGNFVLFPAVKYLQKLVKT